MTGGQGFDVNIGELISHAGKMERLGERMAKVVAAARQVAMNDSAYGVICQPFAVLVKPVERLGMTALEKAAEATGESSSNVRNALAAYDAMDAAGAGAFDGIRRKLP